MSLVLVLLRVVESILYPKLTFAQTNTMERIRRKRNISTIPRHLEVVKLLFGVVAVSSAGSRFWSMDTTTIAVQSFTITTTPTSILQRHASSRSLPRQHICVLSATSGDGSDSEWVKALMEASGDSNPIGTFENEMKLKGLMKGTTTTNPKLTANQRLIDWLQNEGSVYLSEISSWGEAPHPLAISTETKDEITNESSGRGLLARRDINDGDEIIKIPLKLCITKQTARNAMGKDVVTSAMNEYIAMALQLVYEKFIQLDQSTWKEYINVLPEINEVNPTFTWNDDDLNFLQGSPVIAATKSMQMKVTYCIMLFGWMQ
jgi:hypothetical protein